MQTENGDWYWFTHHGSGDWEGRCASPLPVTWIEGWPIIGRVGADGIGDMVLSGKMPVKGTPMVTPQTDDEFNQTNRPPQWECNYQPRADKWSLAERLGWLRLHAFRPLETNNLLKAGNTLTQRCSRTATNEVVVKLDLMGMADGQQAGLCHFAKTYSALGVLQDGAERMLVNLKNGVIPRGPRIAGGRLWLRSVWGLDGQSRYSFSLDGKTFTNFGEPYQLAWGNYRGDRIGLYTCRHPNETLNIHHVARPISFETLAKRRRNLPDLGIELPTGLSADGGVLVQKFEQAFGCKRLYKDFTVRVEDEQEIGWERLVREFFFFDEGNPGGKSVFKGFFAVDQILKCLAEFGLCFPLQV